MPVSLTRITTLRAPSSFASQQTRTATSPPASVNFTALLVRFASTRRSFSQSPIMRGTSKSTRVVKATPFLAATGAMADSTIPTRSFKSTSSRFSVSEPAWMRAHSSTLSTISSKMAPFLSISSNWRRASGRSGPMDSPKSSAKAKMEVSGVRNSWLTMARKSDLYWLSRASWALISSTRRR